jgi:hypothetical protein
MTDDQNKYRISRWLAEFSDPAVEQSFQHHIKPIIIKQLRIALIVWGALLLLFVIPDFIILGPTRPFFYLLTYRIVIIAALLILIFTITPATSIFKISYPVTALAVAGFTGFMLFFIYRPDAIYLILVVIVLQLIGLLMFVPIRFIMSFSAALYGVFITILTRYAMGTPADKLIGLFVLLLLPVVLGTATAIRLGILQRREFALLSRTKKMNLELQNALSEIKQLSGLLPICASCKKIRNDRGYWEHIEGYIKEHSEAEFSHGICPDCAKKLYPDIYEDQ